MTSAYKRVAVGIGAVAFDLILAVWISSLLKLRIANATWRFIHWFSWMGFATALVHAYMTGTDSRKGVGLIMVVHVRRVVSRGGSLALLRSPDPRGGAHGVVPLATPRTPVRPPAPQSRPFITRRDARNQPHVAAPGPHVGKAFPADPTDPTTRPAPRDPSP